MFLFERLIGVGIYSLTLVLVCLSLVGKSYKRIKINLFIYSVILSIFAFAYVPYVTADLYRIYEYINNFQRYTFSALLEQQVTQSDLGAACILYWGIGKIGIPQLLPALNALVCYNCIFYIINKTAIKNSVSSKNVAIALFFYMSIGTYMFVVSGIRSMLGTSLFAFCFFRENVEKKFNIFHIVLYIIAGLTHLFAGALIILRFVIPIFDSKKSFVYKLFYFVFLSIGGILILYRFSDYFESLIAKGNSYLTDDSYTYIWEYVLAIITCLIVFYVFLKWKKVKLNSNLKLNTWQTYGIVILIISILVCFSFTIFHRLTTYALPIISLPLVMTVLQSTDNSKNKLSNLKTPLADIKLNFNYLLVMSSCLLLLIACSRGTLSSLKFFIW